ncbi:MAG: PA14 domain-containing protein [Pseudomonadota bacterium]
MGLVAPASAQFDFQQYSGQWDVLPDFTTLAPVRTGEAGTISAAASDVADNFGLVFTHQIVVSESADYFFQTTSDDGSKLYVGGALVVDNDGLHGAQTVVSSIFLTAGTYPLRVEFFERGGGQVLDVAYRINGGVYAPIPADGQLSSFVPSAADSGVWSPVIPWPHIAITAANLPDGRVLSWSSTEVNAFPSNREYTHASVFDPGNETFINTDSNFHDMFCAGVSMLEDGGVVASGGNPNDNRTSLFDPDSLAWSPLTVMNDNRWYGTNVTLPDNGVFSTFANAAGNRSEVFDPAAGQWTRTPNADMQTLLNEQNAINTAPSPTGATTMQWFAHLAVMPNGRVFHGGPGHP